jgi:predicted phosphodiesterase
MIKAVLTSDLHLTADQNRSAVIPSMKYQPQIMESFFAQVQAMNPSVLILLGDNTNSGRYHDLIRLKKYLKPLCADGIELIMIPGNHDFDIGSQADYERLFFPLLKPLVRDPHSLSYARRIEDVLFLAMDDHEDHRSPAGVLKKETVRWLEEQLVYAERSHLRVIFLSHHSLLAEDWQPRPEFYCLQPDTVLPLLKKYGVRLAFCGHTHDACIAQSGGLHEIAVPMPEESGHLFGMLAVTGGHAEYSLRQISFPARYASLMESAERENVQSKKAVFAALLENSGGSKDEMSEVLLAFTRAHQNGVIHQERNRIMAMAGYRDAMAHLKDNAWGRWMACLMKDGRLPQNSLSIDL